MFFRDTQAVIKGHNPAATFGDISKIVAAMWDNLDDKTKAVSLAITIAIEMNDQLVQSYSLSENYNSINYFCVPFYLQQFYKKRTDAAKKDYLKRLAAYRASQVSQVSCMETVTLLFDEVKVKLS